MLQVMCVMGAWGLWYAQPRSWYALVLALAPFAVSALGKRPPFRATPLDLPMAVFLLTLGVGLWATFDRVGTRAVFPQGIPTGWPVITGHILAVLVYYTIAPIKTEAERRWLSIPLLLFGAGINFYLLMAFDWTRLEDKIDILFRFAQWIQSWFPGGGNGGMHPNTASRMVLTFLPLGLTLIADARDAGVRGRKAWGAYGIVTSFIMAFALVLTSSRGAWLGLVGALMLTALWWLVGRFAQGAARFTIFFAVLGVGSVIGVGTLWLWPALRTWVIHNGAVTNRLALFSQSWLVVRDYPFTGAGLGSFPMVHGIYARLLHVPATAHAHNRMLDIAIAQGIPGLLAVMSAQGIAIVLGMYRLAHIKGRAPALKAGLFALIAVILAGWTDDAFYITWANIPLWMPAALVIAGARQTPTGHPPAPRNRQVQRYLVLGIIVLLGIFTAAFWTPLRALWYTNLGAVYQTQLELQTYDSNNYDKLTLDQVRQEANLSIAEAYFNRALMINPSQVTARTRLAQIALARGHYGEALSHAQAAWDGGHRDHVTRLVLGDALTAMGEVEAAVEVVREQSDAKVRLDGQAWSRYWVNGDYQRAAHAWRAALLLDPGDERVRQWLEKAESQLDEP
ncbi:MAG: O-antigen ligase family protein [Anaerolineae bacterium]|nr:O-antigen ligase family protein [Anaerolineae bacterium]